MKSGQNPYGILSCGILSRIPVCVCVCAYEIIIMLYINRRDDDRLIGVL